MRGIMTDRLVEHVSFLAECELLEKLCMEELHRYIRDRCKMPTGHYFHDTVACGYLFDVMDGKMDDWSVKRALRHMAEIAAAKRKLPDAGDYE